MLHHMKGKLTKRGILEAIISGEKEECIAYFPDKKFLFDDIEDKLNYYIYKVEEEYNKIKHVESMKEFASYAVLLDCNSAMFAVKRGKCSSIRKYILSMQIDKIMEHIKL